MTYNEIVSRVSEELGIPSVTVDKAYRAYWRAVREHVISLPLKEQHTEDSFRKLQPNVNIPSIGKLYVTYDRYRRMKKGNDIINSRIKNKKAEENVTHQED